MIIKVIYFDEGSATDLIHLVKGGDLDEIETTVSQRSAKIAASAKAMLSTSFKWLPFFKTEASADLATDVSLSGTRMIEKAITNTILTDYMKLLDKDIHYIKQFKNVNIRTYKESITYLKIITPYMLMTEGKYEVDSDMSLNIAKMDEAFENAKGYYELIVKEGDEEYVLRFNIQAFRNNYGISDLTKMKLTYHAIEVGTIDMAKLDMKYEFDIETHDSISGIDIVNGEEDTLKMVKVFDVILAGVSHE